MEDDVNMRTHHMNLSYAEVRLRMIENLMHENHHEGPVGGANDEIVLLSLPFSTLKVYVDMIKNLHFSPSGCISLWQLFSLIPSPFLKNLIF